jgi:hypothetical protein
MDIKSINGIQEAIFVELLIFLFRSGLQREEGLTISAKRAEKYRQVKGLL